MTAPARTAARALRDLLRPQGRPRYADGVAAGLALVVPLVVGTLSGRPGTGAAIALPAVLLAMPLPAGAGPRGRVRCLAVRTAWTTAAGVYTTLAGHGMPVLALGVAATAFAGSVLPGVGVTAPLAVLLTGITGDGREQTVPGLLQLVGCVWTAALLLPRRYHGGGDDAAPPSPSPPPRAVRVRHGARLALLTGGAVAVTGVSGTLWGQGHWLVTALLLTLRPTPEETRTRFAQRIVGNTAGGVVTALLLLSSPGPYAVAAVVGVSGALAYAFRTANYTYWALASPVLLLLLSDYGEPLPWWAAAVRAGLNALGGCVALLATRWLWPGAGAGAVARP
ncbi:FUSC family protein [Streptomyces sp. AV19]|uniref:FUSC family protein n=1 Tax=Streptomyces sp. AV19 TaxID=2793068 RepID=UPI0018FE9F07|nr:FUSC family protein [Streptomyces sp. AV19]MBH1932970.1 FUSC family protein [Streptomyces sp. AV19]MDG4533859.1 FUSC family protein [Streptomyces sp. AV19]